MGSLQLKVAEQDQTGRRFGSSVSEYSFPDRDGVFVLVSLYLDRAGRPFELDVWKTDFSALLEVPPTDEGPDRAGA
jgi:hypothetical protein